MSTLRTLLLQDDLARTYGCQLKPELRAAIERQLTESPQALASDVDREVPALSSYGWAAPENVNVQFENGDCYAKS